MDLEKLEKLNELKEKGILSQEEFEKEKQKLLNDTPVKAEPASSGYPDCSHLGIIKGAVFALASSFKRWDDFKGRTSRFDFFGATFFLFFFLGFIRILSIVVYPRIDLLVFPVLWIETSLLIRRFHDINKSGWWMLTIVVPVCTIFFKGDNETNRFGPAPATDEEKVNGLLIFCVLFTLLEPLILNIFEQGASAFVSGFTGAYKKHKTSDQVQTMVSKIRTIYSTQKSYKDIGKPSSLYSLGIFNDDICGDSECENPKNPYGGKISVSSDERNNHKTYSIAYHGIPKEFCIELAAQDWGDRASGLRGIIINSDEFKAGTRIKEEIAQKACSSAENLIMWEYR